MRLGEILLGAGLVTPYQLAQGLDYAKFKVMPIGRVMILLRHLEEEGLKQALQTQQLIRGGMPGEQALALLRQAIKSKTPLPAANQPQNNLPKTTADFSLSNFAFSTRSLSSSPPSSPLSAESSLPASGSSSPDAPSPVPGVSAPPETSPSPLPASPLSVPSPPILSPPAPLPAAGEALASPGEAAVPASGNTLTLEQLMQKAETYLQMDECTEALAHYQEARRRLEAGNEPLSTVYLDVLRKIGNIYFLIEDRVAAQKLFEEGMAVCSTQEGVFHFYFLQFRCDFADLMVADGQAEAALAMLVGLLIEGLPYLQERQSDYVAWLRRLINCETQVRPAVRKKLGEILLSAELLSPEQLQQALSASHSSGIPLGRTLKEINLLSERELQSVLKAQTLLKEGIIGERTAEIGLRVARILNQNLEVFFAQNQILREDLANADPNYVQLILMQDQILVLEVSHGPEHIEVGKALLALAELHELRGHFCDAEVSLKRAEKILKRQSDDCNPALAAKLYRGLSRITLRTGQLILAQEYLLAFLELLNRIGKETSEEAAECLLNLALVEQRQGSLPAYMQYLSMYMSVVRQLDHAEPMSMESLQEAAHFFNEGGMHAPLEELLNWQLHLTQRKFGQFEPEAAEIMLLLGDACMAAGEREKAQMHYHFASQIYEHSLGKEDKAEIARVKLYKCLP